MSLGDITSSVSECLNMVAIGDDELTPCSNVVTFRVNDMKGQLVHVGDYVRVECEQVTHICVNTYYSFLETEQVNFKYGELLACVQAKTREFCLVRQLEKMEFCNQTGNNEFDCPIFTQTDSITAIPDIT